MTLVGFVAVLLAASVGTIPGVTKPLVSEADLRLIGTSGDTMLWTQNIPSVRYYTPHLFRRSTGTSAALPFRTSQIVASDENILYLDSDAQDLRLYSLKTQKTKTIQAATPGWSIQDLMVSSDVATWTMYTPTDERHLYIYDFARDRTFEAFSTDEIGAILIGGPTVVYSDRGFIRVYDSRTGSYSSYTWPASSHAVMLRVSDDRLLTYSDSNFNVQALDGRILASLPANDATQSPFVAFDGEWVAFADQVTRQTFLWRWTTGDLFRAKDADTGWDINQWWSPAMLLENGRLTYLVNEPKESIRDFTFRAPANTVSFSDNFDACAENAKLGARWTTRGNWYCKTQRARGEGQDGLALADTAGMQTTDVSARVQLNTADKSGVVARAQGDSYYAARLRASGHVELIRVNDGVVEVLGEYKVAVEQNRSYRLRLRVSGTNPVNLALDFADATVVTATDSSAARLLGGFAGLLHREGSRTQFDDFAVTGSAPAFEGSAPPPPPPDEDVAFKDDFDACAENAALGARWSTSGTWYCKTQRARGEKDATLALAKTAEMHTTDVGARVQLNAADKSGVAARVKGGSYYAARLRSSGWVEIIRANGAAVQVLASLPTSVVQDKSYALRLRVSGTDTVRLTLDLGGATVLTVDDASAARLGSGLAGLLFGTGSRSQYDDFVLAGSKSSGPAPVDPPVDPPGPVAFADNFDACTATAGLGAKWDASSAWYCKTQRARGEGTPGVALAKTAAMTTTDVSALVQLNESSATGMTSGSGVVARAADGRFYAARLLRTGRLQLVRVDNDAVTVLGDVPLAVALDTSYVLRLQVSGSSAVQLTASVKGVPLVTATDSGSARLASGRAGLLHGGPARTQFDDFKLTGSAP